MSNDKEQESNKPETKEDKNRRLNLLLSEEYVNEYFEAFSFDDTPLLNIKKWVLGIQSELREELRKAQEENEELASDFEFIAQENKDLQSQIERLKALFPECWNAARNFYDGHTFSKRYLTLNEWKKDKGI